MVRNLSLALTGALLLVFASDAQAGRRGNRYQQSYRPVSQPMYQAGYQVSYSTASATPVAAPVAVGNQQSPVTTTSNYQQLAPVQPSGDDALAEVNAQRASRGLRPFIRDEGLTQAARACAVYRAQYRIEGHTSNDFGFVPAGSFATSAGCAAWPASMGWGSCCTYDGYTYAGAAWSIGADGQRYMSLFVR